MSCKLDITLHGTSLSIVRQCGYALSDVLQSKFGCVATIEGVDIEREDVSSTQHRRPTIVPERRFAATLPGNIQVSVWKADLSNFHVDAVVNAANSSLQHYGGLALALSNAGGPQIQRESDNHIKMYGDLKTGSSVALDPGFLPCKKVIHAVGPHLSNRPLKSEVLAAESFLVMAIESILDRVKELRLQSVAIPAISSGLFNYPLTECANTIVTTVKRYYSSSRSSGHLPREICLVNNDERTVKEMERACHHILAASKSKGDGKTSTLTAQLGNVHLTLKRGKIEEQQTDVLVNTMSPQRDLKVGEISQALFKKAGQEMQNEVYNAPQTGNVIITKAYKLSCKEVFHTCCIEKGKMDAHQILLKSVLECLWLASAHIHKSIAFPAIGTGALGFDRKEVAHIMLTAVSDFSQKFPQKMDVFFVIYPADDSTFKAFAAEIENLQQKSSHPSFTHDVDRTMASMSASGPSGGFHGGGAPTPQISLSGPSDEMIREADRWLTRLLFKSSDTVVICNNFIQHFGEEEHLQLSRLTKGGVSIEEFFQKGRAGIIVNGDLEKDVVVAGLQVEAMLCKIQKQFAVEESDMLHDLVTNRVTFERKTVDKSSPEFMERSAAFTKSGLRILKMDRVENPTLMMMFELKKNQLCCSTSRKMLQRIPAQFCQMVSHIGFHAEYAPPDEPAYGEGIYFADVNMAMEVWPEQMEEYVYFVEAEVLTGRSAPGKPGLILPPAVGSDPDLMYDSVSGGPHISVIFSGYQALPSYIITCKMI